MGPLLIGGLVGCAFGLLVYSLIHRLGARRPLLPKANWGSSAAGWLRLVPVPGAPARRWSGDQMDLRLRRAGLPWPAEAFVGLRWLGWLVASLVALASWGFLGRGVIAGFLGLLVLVLGIWGPQLWLQARQNRRRQEVEADLPALLDRLILSLEAGLGFETAFRRAAFSLDRALGVELRRALFRLDAGLTKGEVMGRLTLELPSTDLRSFAASVQQAERLGTSLAKTLRVQARLLRAERRRRAQEASRRLPVLIVFPLVLFFLPSMLIIYLAPPLLHLFLGR